MLHILDGECSAEILRQSEVPGEIFAWREALIDGPTPAGLDAVEWRHTRAGHLANHYGLDEGECETKLLEQEAILDSSASHDEVVLWFEHDLFCQTNLLYVLDWFERRDLDETKLSLIFIGEFPGVENFRGLGQLEAWQFASLFAARSEVTSDQLSTAKKAWAAYCAPDPNAILQILKEDLDAISFLRRAFELHLARFPSIANGLGQIEQTALELTASGATKFGDLFRSFVNKYPAYGLGDSQFWLSLNSMAEAREPLLEVSGTSEDFVGSNVAITDTGRAVMNGERDAIALNGIDRWFGGVHLHAGNIWRWDGVTLVQD